MRRLGVALALLALTAGCATEHVVLLPGESGHPVGALAVINEDGSDRGVLNTAYSGAGLSAGGGKVTGRAEQQAGVDGRYGRLVADLPPPAISIRVPFDFGTAAPGPDAQAMLQQLFAEIGKRPGAQVQVIGHADAVGTDEVNDKFSRDRAAVVHDYLVANGVTADQIRVSWVGKREPVHRVEGPDDDNRKAEVLVR